MVYVQKILDNMKICVIIPTYNESKTISSLIEKIRLLGLDILVIDDGSTDNTAEIAQGNAALVLRNPHNEGKGASLTLGFCYAVTNCYDAVITMDGDGQHLPEEITLFLETAKISNAGIILGNRMSGHQNMPFIRILTNKFMSWLISLIAGQKIPDTQCGFRFIRSDVLKNINLRTTKYETESEILIKSARLGFKIESIPITTVYRGERSKINPFLDTMRFINFIIREAWITRN